MQDSPQQNCHLLKLSTELRLEICRFTIQHDLTAIKSTPHSYNSTTQLFRGALALLHTCRTLRTESIDAMDPLARAWKFDLDMEWVDADASLFVERLLGTLGRRQITEQPDASFERLNASIGHMDKVCEVLALARSVDEKSSVTCEKQ